ncbi:MAG: diaminopimelate decarboxylase [Eubacteriales bacterium]|nr:diaminopimelate decarboxylase [Eubacteriales bacterium]MDN5364761.1 diaminopimelate decarboxylase [Eubacteriales bacterium]
MKLQGTMRINEKGHLEIGGCDTVELAREFGTPLYVLDEQFLRDNCRQYRRAFMERYDKALVIYASKALATTAVFRIIEEEGLGLDVVSGGEIFTALEAGFPMEKVYFHGNNKSPQELRLALEVGVGRIVVDNLYEMELLNSIALEMGKKADILIRITPGIEAHTHDYIRTGQIDSKFGLVLSNGQAMEGVKKALTLPGLNFLGVHCHIGSQIFELESYRHAAEVMMDFIRQIKDETDVTVQELNLGGGFGIYYAAGDRPASVEAYAYMVMEAVHRKAEELRLPVPLVIVEPGRSIVGPAGTTLYAVGAVKEIPGVRKYVAVDGGMSDNPRPALYQARYEAMLANKAAERPVELVSIAGKCCESGDMLIWDITLPPVEPGDILAVACTGAYNYSMASNYNRLPRPAMVLVKDGQADLIVRRESYEDLVRNDVIPPRLQKK